VVNFEKHKQSDLEDVFFLQIISSCHKQSGIMVQDKTAQELEKRMDELARKYADSHGEDIKTELRELSQQIAEMKKRLICQ
jgi:hypothetical protein